MSEEESVYYLVSGHLNGDWWEKVDPEDPNQEDEIQATCEECGDSDWIEGTASTAKEARDLCRLAYSDKDYAKKMYEEFLGLKKKESQGAE